MVSNEFYKKILDTASLPCQKPVTVIPVGGGCINQTYRLSTSGSSFFLKLNIPDEIDNFNAEKEGLEMMSQHYPNQIPVPLAVGIMEAHSYFLMEFIDPAPRVKNFWENFGEALASMHRQHADRFGLGFDNYIGKLPQNNKWKNGWYDFFIQNRLKPQIELALRKGLIDGAIMDLFNKAFSKLENFFPEESPSFLHGDLWGGNFLTGSDGKASIIDPAVYYGHREIELSFTKLFGGFDRQFYSAYENAFPLQPGFEERIDIYNLYPLMVHVNIFGTSYLSGVLRTLKQFT